MTSSNTTPVWFGDKISPGRFALLLGLLIFAAYPKVLLGIESFFFRDYGVLGYPFVYYHREAFWRGELPLWNPLSNCGAPFLAQWGTMVLYPFSLIYLVLPLPWSLGFFCLLHLFLAGLGMYYLARRWVNDDFAASVAGVAFVFNGVVFSCLLWPNYTVALGWMPWVVLATERAWQHGGRAVVVAALVGTLQMLSGVPELIVFTWLAVLAAWMAERPKSQTGASLRRVLGVIGLVAVLAACQLLPFFDLLAHSHRTAETGGVKWAMPGWGWANLLVPLFHTYEGHHGVIFQFDQAFMTSYYPGIAILVLAIWGAWHARTLRSSILLGLVIAGYLLALGPNSPVFTWIKSAVPAIGFARFPVKFTLLSAFALPLLAAVAVAQLRQRREHPTNRGLWILCLSAIGAVAALLWFARNYPYPLQDWGELWRNSVLRVAFLALIVLTALWACKAPSVKAGRAAMLSCIALIALDAVTHTHQQNPTIAPSNFAPDIWRHRFAGAPRPLRVAITPDAEARLLRSSITDPTRDFLTKRLALWSNLNLLDGVAKVNGSSTLQLARQKDVERRLYPTNAQSVRWSRGLLDFLGVTHLTGTNLTDWIRHPTALPLVTCGQEPRFVPDAEALDTVTSAEFEPRTHVYLPADARTQCAATGRGEARVDSLKTGAQKISCVVECEQPTVVVVAQSFHRNWGATVGGGSAPVWRANYAFQAVQVPAGRHELVLEYRDAPFTIGAILSVLGLAACLLLWQRKRDVPVQVPEPAASRTGEERAAEKAA